MPMIDPLQQALDQLRALSGGGQTINMPEDPVQSQAGNLAVPRAPDMRGPDFTGMYTSLPSVDEREQLIAQDGLDLTPTRDYNVEDPTPQPPPTLNEQLADKSAALGMESVPSPRSVDEGTRMVDDQLTKSARARAVADQAKLEATKSHAAAMADAADRGVQEQGNIAAQHQRTLANINAQADMEQANWLQGMSDLAKQEPNPGRWWENQSGLGKALWAMSLAFGSAYKAITPGAKNAALDMVREEIQRDMNMQQARLKQQMAVGEMKGAAMRDRATRNRSDEQDRYGQELGRVMALQRAWEARAQIPNAMDDQAGLLESKAWLEQQKLPLFESRRTEKVQAASAAATRAHQTAMQATQIKAQKEQADLDRAQRLQIAEMENQRAYDLAQLSVSAKGPRYNAQGKPVDENGIPLFRSPLSGTAAGKSTGAVLVGPDGKPANGDGSVNFRKEDDKQAKDFAEISSGANRRYRAMTRLNELLNDQSRLGAFLAGTTDPEITSLITQLGTEGAKADDPGGKYTNQDFSRGIAGRLGFDPNGGWLDRTKFAASIPELRANLEKQIKQMPIDVAQALNGTIDANINGGQGARVVWHPVDLNVPQVKERSEGDITGAPEVNLKDKPVAGVDDYRKRVQVEDGNAARVGMELPTHERDKVMAVIAAAEDKSGKVSRSPDAITKEAQKILQELDQREAALKEKVDPWGSNGKPKPGGGVDATWSQDDMEQLTRIANTRKIVESVATDEVKRATKKLKDIEKYVKSTPFLSPESHRKNISRRYGMTGAPREIDAIIEKARSEPTTALDLIGE